MRLQIRKVCNAHEIEHYKVYQPVFMNIKTILSCWLLPGSLLVLDNVYYDPIILILIFIIKWIIHD